MVRRILSVIFALIGLAAIVVAVYFEITAVRDLLAFYNTGYDPIATPFAIVIFIVMVCVWAALGIIGLAIFIPSVIGIFHAPRRRIKV